ncbi:MAG: fused MFS/spermidine synthase [Bacteroidota bacterium]
MGKTSRSSLAQPIPWWKLWWSYLFEMHIESAPNEVNPHLYVSLRNGRYQLSTANAIYSYEDLYTNFYQAFHQVQLPDNQRDVLLLGFGLGSIPRMLEQRFQKHYHYTAVELDESVLYLAQKYTLPQLTSPIETICTDAYAYVLQSKQQYDLICMDVFLDDTIPEQFQTVEYLQALKQLLLPDSVLLYNCLAAKKEDQLASQQFYEKQFLAVFPEGTYLQVDGNWILLNDKRFLRKSLG